MAKELTKIRQLSDISPSKWWWNPGYVDREETQVSSWGPQAGSWGFSSLLSSPPNAVLLGSQHFSLAIRLDIVLSYLYKLQRLSGLCLLPGVTRLSQDSLWRLHQNYSEDHWRKEGRTKVKGGDKGKRGDMQVSSDVCSEASFSTEQVCGLGEAAELPWFSYFPVAVTNYQTKAT